MTTDETHAGKFGKTRFSWRARGRSFVYAWHGIRTLLSGEHNSRLHLAAAVMACMAGAVLKISATEWSVVAVCIGSVLMAEAFNSALEALADRTTREHDPLIGKAKDLAAGAVLLMAIGAAVAGAIIFLPKIISLAGAN